MSLDFLEGLQIEHKGILNVGDHHHCKPLRLQQQTMEFCGRYFLWSLLKTNQRFSVAILYSITGWWFQPLWKILVKMGNLPQIGVKIKNIWNHHPDNLQIVQSILLGVGMWDSYTSTQQVKLLPPTPTRKRIMTSWKYKQLQIHSSFMQWFCPHTMGRYPRLPQTPTKKETPLEIVDEICQGMFQVALWVRS